MFGCPKWPAKPDDLIINQESKKDKVNGYEGSALYAKGRLIRIIRILIKMKQRRDKEKMMVPGCFEDKVKK